MTYLESYRQCNTLKELINRVKADTKVAIFLGSNPDRIKAIENAMNEREKELGGDTE